MKRVFFVVPKPGGGGRRRPEVEILDGAQPKETAKKGNLGPAFGPVYLHGHTANREFPLFALPITTQRAPRGNWGPLSSASCAVFLFFVFLPSSRSAAFHIPPAVTKIPSSSIVLPLVARP